MLEIKLEIFEFIPQAGYVVKLRAVVGKFVAEKKIICIAVNLVARNYFVGIYKRFNAAAA